MIDPDPLELYDLGDEILDLLTGVGDRPTRVALHPGRPDYLRGAVDGVEFDGAQWTWNGQPVARAGLWITAEADISGAIGPVDPTVDLTSLKEFLRSGPPPAGGISIDLSVLLEMRIAHSMDHH